MKNTPKHSIRKLSSVTKKDLQWWVNFVSIYDRVSFMHELEWRKIDSVIETDACLQGIGGFFNGEYFHSSIPDDIKGRKDMHINKLECLAVVVALKAWGQELQGLNILMHCDNEPTVKIVNKGCRSNQFPQSCLKRNCVSFWHVQFSCQNGS